MIYFILCTCYVYIYILNTYIYYVYYYIVSYIYDVFFGLFRISIQEWISSFAYISLAVVFNIDFHSNIIHEILQNVFPPKGGPFQAIVGPGPGRLCSEANSEADHLRDASCICQDSVSLRLGCPSPRALNPAGNAWIWHARHAIFHQEKAGKTRRGPD